MAADWKAHYTPWNAFKGEGALLRTENHMKFADPLNLFGMQGKSYVDTAGAQPDTLQYEQAYDPSTMSLADYLQGKYDHSGFDKFKSEAMRVGPSTWAKMSTQDQKARAADLRERAAAQSNAQAAQSMDALAARGGLSSGARERAGMEGAKNFLSMSQDLGRQETLNNLQVGINDELNRVNQLSQLPGMEMNQAKLWEDAKQKDIANTVNENQARNAWNQNIYNQKMHAWGTAKTADAQANSGKK